MSSYLRIKGANTAAEAEIPISDLLSDAVVGAPGLLDDDQSVTGRLMGSSQSHRVLLGVSKSKKTDTPIIKAFRAKLQEVGCTTRCDALSCVG